MTAAGSSDDLDQMRQDIQQTRAQLGETVAALAAKTDVKTRLRSKAKADADSLRSKATAGADSLRSKASVASSGLWHRATRASQSTRTAATTLIRTVGQKASQTTKPVTNKAEQATTAARDAARAGARTTTKAGSALASSARNATKKVGSATREKKPVPILATATAATAATAAVAAYRRRLRRDQEENIVNGKLMFGAGLGLGYVLGTRAGWERFSQISGRAKQVWESKPVQDAADAVQERVGLLHVSG
jgi:hypothetical protein